MTMTQTALARLKDTVLLLFSVLIFNFGRMICRIRCLPCCVLCVHDFVIRASILKTYGKFANKFSSFGILQYTQSEFLLYFFSHQKNFFKFTWNAIKQFVIVCVWHERETVRYHFGQWKLHLRYCMWARSTAKKNMIKIKFAIKYKNDIEISILINVIVNENKKHKSIRKRINLLPHFIPYANHKTLSIWIWIHKKTWNSWYR